jgi:LPXTG-motif cell wall-anchored protein
MKIGDTIVDPVADVGTRVFSGVSEEGMTYTGGVVFNNEAYTSKSFSGLADKLNGNFAAFPVELTQFGITNNSLKAWKSDNEVTFAEDYAEAFYVQPEAEIVKKPELKLNDGTWYGRDDDKKVTVTITVNDGEITKIVSSDGSTEGEAYEDALQTAKDKSTYNDKTSYAPADVSVFAGGLAGMTNRSAQVNCCTLGNISANAESNNKAMVGGLTGMSGGTNINCYTRGNVESLITTVDIGGINGRSAGIAADHCCYFNSSAVYKAAGKVLDKYTVDPKTGKGTDSEGKAVDLPQTGNNSVTNLLILLGAVMFMVTGAFAVRASERFRRREDKQ